MSSVFTRGRMRLYLLKLLSEQPRHGYEMLRVLEERLGSAYAPSPGSVYPRLRNLEAGGLVSHEERDGRKIYRLTDRGRREVDERGADIAALETDIRTVSELAEDIGEDVHSAVREAHGEIADAVRGLPARSGRRPRRPGGQRRRHEEWAAAEFDPSGGMIEAQLGVLVARVRQLTAESPPTSEQIGACAAILHEAYQRLSEVFEEPAE